MLKGAQICTLHLFTHQSLIFSRPPPSPLLIPFLIPHTSLLWLSLCSTNSLIQSYLPATSNSTHRLCPSSRAGWECERDTCGGGALRPRNQKRIDRGTKKDMSWLAEESGHWYAGLAQGMTADTYSVHICSGQTGWTDNTDIYRAFILGITTCYNEWDRGTDIPCFLAIVSPKAVFCYASGCVKIFEIEGRDGIFCKCTHMPSERWFQFCINSHPCTPWERGPQSSNCRYKWRTAQWWFPNTFQNCHGYATLPSHV